MRLRGRRPRWTPAWRRLARTALRLPLAGVRYVLLGVLGLRRTRREVRRG